MRRCFITSLISILLVASCLAQNVSFGRFVVDTLASEFLKGRGYTFKGDQRAAYFIRDQFDQLNIEPLDDQHFQFFTIDINTFPDKVSLATGTNILTPGVDFLVSPDCPSVDGDYKTVTIKRKDLINRKRLKKLIEKSTGGFIVIDETEPDELNKKEIKATDEIINALRYDPNLTHAGVVLMTNNKLTWHVAGFQAPRPYFIVNKKTTDGAIKSLTVNVEAVLKENYQTQNVVGMIEGGMMPDSFLVVLAHYDHLGTMGKTVYFPGANDNASGVAMLLSLAKHYSEHPPDYSIVFIALGAEEAGLLGAKTFVEEPLFDLTRVKFLVNFDLAGTGNEGIKVVNATVFEQEFNRLKELNKDHDLMKSVQPRGEACNSDHCLFYRAGVPSFYIYTLGGIAAYHDIYDRPETLPLTEFEDYLDLMIRFFDGF